MHSIESIHPSPELRKYVRAYAQRTTDKRNAPLTARAPARLEQILEFQFKDCFDIHFDNGLCMTTPRIAVIGPQTRLRASVTYRGEIESFAVFFHPSGFSQIFGVPMRELVNAGNDAMPILGRRILDVWNELGETNEFERRVGIIERFLTNTPVRIHFDDQMLETSNRMLDLQGRIGIAELASRQGMSLRHFERTFMAQVGIAPKLYSRIARFQTALDMKVATQRMTWIEISHTLDYHDQMHMIHDFKSLGGGSPGCVLEHLGDMRPDALASCSLKNSKSSRIFTMRRPVEADILLAS